MPDTIDASSARASRPPKTPVSIGDTGEVEIGPVAHGGHFIAHMSGHTVLVRHALPGERVRIRITDVSSKIVRADAIEVIDSSKSRVTAPCEWARPGGCGGCDFQHAAPESQRDLKAEVVRDSLRRYGGLTGDLLDGIEVASLDDGAVGLGWRTRVRWSVGPDGRPGLLANRSHDVVPVGRCLLASPAIDALNVPGQVFRGATEVRTVEGQGGQVSVVVDGAVVSGKRRVEQQVGGRSWRVDVDSFWQVHPRAAETLVAAVLAAGQPLSGEKWWDLYAGVGLFSAFVAEAVEGGGEVHAVESGASAVRDARRSLHDLAQVTLHEQDVLGWLRAADEQPDGVILDPPRAGAGQRVVEAIAQARPRVVVYVACDPVALARDIALFANVGYRPETVRAFDTFPMTHHVETVASLVPVDGGHQIS